MSHWLRQKNRGFFVAWALNLSSSNCSKVMNVLKEIEAQINSIKKIDSSTYLDAIFAHIERAEFYYNSGITDSNFFNDVIYRSNQAYEGALKESYKVLAEKTADEVLKKTPNDIENFFEKESIFKERVLQLFKNYRQEWRNKSTHDYKLFFDESEAFIALTSVSSFVHLLLKQIQEKTAYLAQQKKLTTELASDKPIQVDDIQPTRFMDIVVSMLSKFTIEKDAYSEKVDNLREEEILGIMHAYLEFTGYKFKVSREPKLELQGRILRPDFILQMGDERIIVEVKNRKSRKSDTQLSVNQVLQFMEASGIPKGILFFTNSEQVIEELKVSKVLRLINDIEYQVVLIGL